MAGGLVSPSCLMGHCKHVLHRTALHSTLFRTDHFGRSLTHCIIAAGAKTLKSCGPPIAFDWQLGAGSLTSSLGHPVINVFQSDSHHLVTFLAAIPLPPHRPHIHVHSSEILYAYISALQACGQTRPLEGLPRVCPANKRFMAAQVHGFPDPSSLASAVRAWPMNHPDRELLNNHNENLLCPHAAANTHRIFPTMVFDWLVGWLVAYLVCLLASWSLG